MVEQIIMNFSVPPSADDLSVIAQAQLQNMPDELQDHIENLSILIEEIPDDATQSDLDLDDPYELLVFYKAGKELTPGVEKKVANDDDELILYRRSILDYWCETGEDLTSLIREAMIEEIATYFDFPEDDITEMTRRHHQGML